MINWRFYDIGDAQFQLCKCRILSFACTAPLHICWLEVDSRTPHLRVIFHVIKLGLRILHLPGDESSLVCRSDSNEPCCKLGLIVNAGGFPWLFQIHCDLGFLGIGLSNICPLVRAVIYKLQYVHLTSLSCSISSSLSSYSFSDSSSLDSS